MELPKIKIECDTSQLDNAIEKANQLKELLQEVHSLINSLGSKTNTHDLVDCFSEKFANALIESTNHLHV